MKLNLIKVQAAERDRDMYNRQDTDNIHIHQTMDAMCQQDMSDKLEAK